MKNLFEAPTAAEVKERLSKVRPNSERLWGKMTPAQTFAHCTAAFCMAEGKVTPGRVLIGRLFGPLAKRAVITNGAPIRRNAPTQKSVLVVDERDFLRERNQLEKAIDHFVTAGPAVCTKHPHFFFGPLTPVEWAVLMYQHLDHHLRQFGA